MFRTFDKTFKPKVIMNLKPYLVEKVKSIGFDIDQCKDLKELSKLLPDNYLFIEQRLWVGRLYVDADDYDYANAILKMLILINQNI